MKKIFSILVLVVLVASVSMAQSKKETVDGIQKTNSTVKMVENNKAQSIVNGNKSQAASEAGIEEAVIEEVEAKEAEATQEAAAPAKSKSKSKKACCAKSKKSCGGSKSPGK